MTSYRLQTTGWSVVLVFLFLSGCGKAESPEDVGRPANETDAGNSEVRSPTSDSTANLPADTASSAVEPRMTQDENGSMKASNNFYEISTPLGKMVVRLYDETPKHRDNFKKLVDEGYYDGTTFHRVMEGFMIQGGDGNSKDDDPYNDGQGGPGYTIEAEFRPGLFHKKGALAAARQGDQMNPQRRSSGSQFYIVQGTVLTPRELADMEAQMKQRDPSFSISPEAAAAYSKVGGTPFLDGQYTVFGELVEGFDVLDKIAATETPRKLGQPSSGVLADRPPTDIKMTVRPLPDYAVQ